MSSTPVMSSSSQKKRKHSVFKEKSILKFFRSEIYFVFFSLSYSVHGSALLLESLSRILRHINTESFSADIYKVYRRFRSACPRYCFMISLTNIRCIKFLRIIAISTKELHYALRLPF